MATCPMACTYSFIARPRSPKTNEVLFANGRRTLANTDPLVSLYPHEPGPLRRLPCKITCGDDNLESLLTYFSLHRCYYGCICVGPNCNSFGCPEFEVSQRTRIGGPSDKSLLWQLASCGRRQETLRPELFAVPWQQPAGHGTGACAADSVGEERQVRGAFLVRDQRRFEQGNAGLDAAAQAATVADRDFSGIKELGPVARRLLARWGSMRPHRRSACRRDHRPLWTASAAVVLCHCYESRISAITEP
jgi:hypothetical protein